MALQPVLTESHSDCIATGSSTGMIIGRSRCQLTSTPRRVSASEWNTNPRQHCIIYDPVVDFTLWVIIVYKTKHRQLTHICMQAGTSAQINL